jgi:hypothetical protein
VSTARIPYRYDIDAGRSSPMYPLYRLWMFGIGSLPEVDAIWQLEEAEWLGNSTRPAFGLLVDVRDVL